MPLCLIFFSASWDSLGYWDKESGEDVPQKRGYFRNNIMDFKPMEKL